MGSKFFITRCVNVYLGEMKKRIGKAAAWCERRIKIKIRKHGKVIGRRNGRMRREPSIAPLGPYAVTGALRASIGSEVHVQGLQVHGYVGIRQGATENYGRRLEFGNGKVAPRLYIRGTVLAEQGRVDELVRGGK